VRIAGHRESLTYVLRSVFTLGTIDFCRMFLGCRLKRGKGQSPEHDLRAAE
jgi:hypothetical protein